MGTPPHRRRLLDRILESFGRLAGKRWRRRPPAMIGLPPSARGLTGRPVDPASHAIEVAREWEDVAAVYIRERMHWLGIPDHQVGAPDYERGGVRRVFLAEESLGGSCGTGRRLFVDSGVLNPELDAALIGPEASRVWAKSRLRDRDRRGDRA